MSSASLAGVRLTASRVRTQARWDPLRPRARGRAKRLRKRRAHGPQQMVCQASERPRKFSKQLQSQGRRGKGTWDHSGLVPNETFRYQVKVLALSKAQTKVLPLPCPLLIPRRGTGSSSRGSSKPRTPSLGGYRQLPSCWASPWCQRAEARALRPPRRILEPAEGVPLRGERLGLPPRAKSLQCAGQVSSSAGGRTGRTLHRGEAEGTQGRGSIHRSSPPGSSRAAPLAQHTLR